MNRLNGTLKQIQAHEGISLARIALDNSEVQLSALLINNNQTKRNLNTGIPVQISFKEIEVCIAKGETEQISMQNQLPCTIESIHRGVILTELKLRFEKHQIDSIITTRAVQKLDLKPNDRVTALIKTNELNLSFND